MERYIGRDLFVLVPSHVYGAIVYQSLTPRVTVGITARNDITLRAGIKKRRQPRRMTRQRIDGAETGGTRGEQDPPIYFRFLSVGRRSRSRARISGPWIGHALRRLCRSFAACGLA